MDLLSEYNKPTNVSRNGKSGYTTISYPYGRYTIRQGKLVPKGSVGISPLYDLEEHTLGTSNLKKLNEMRPYLEKIFPLRHGALELPLIIGASRILAAGRNYGNPDDDYHWISLAVRCDRTPVNKGNGGDI